jgi:hypothetical protein
MGFDGLEVVEYSWREIRDKYRELTDPDKAPELPSKHGSQLPRLVHEWRSERRGGFYGCGSDDMRGWLRDGFDVKKLARSQRPAILDGHRPKWRWSDDPSRGQYQHEAGMIGDPSCYLARDRRRSMAGIRVEVGTVFVAYTPAELVAEYGAWCGSVLRTLEAAGYDLDVTLVADSEDLYPRRTFRAKIHCSGFGKRTLFRDWSALFSPGGYRHLCFMAWCLPEYDDKHARAAGGLGHGTYESARDWSVTFEEATRTLSIIPKYMASGDFPREDMTAKLTEAFK